MKSWIVYCYASLETVIRDGKQTCVNNVNKKCFVFGLGNGYRLSDPLPSPQVKKSLRLTGLRSELRRVCSSESVVRVTGSLMA
jgi:hypothetical protein